MSTTDHRYFFRLCALDSALELTLWASKDQVLAAAEGYIIARGELMGTFQRQIAPALALIRVTRGGPTGHVERSQQVLAADGIAL